MKFNVEASSGKQLWETEKKSVYLLFGCHIGQINFISGGEFG